MYGCLKYCTEYSHKNVGREGGGGGGGGVLW